MKQLLHYFTRDNIVITLVGVFIAYYLVFELL